MFVSSEPITYFARNSLTFVFVTVFSNDLSSLSEGTRSILERTLGVVVNGVVSSSGGQKLGFAGTGFNTKDYYRCRFSDGNHSMYSDETVAEASDLLLCTTPQWGLKYPAASSVSVSVQYLSSVKALPPTPTPSFPQTNSSNPGRRLLQASSDQSTLFDAVTGRLWAPSFGPSVTMEFRLEVIAARLASVDYGAKGGTLLVITAPGMRLGLEHYCKFETDSGHIMQSSFSEAVNVSTLKCT
jgi:hypothetical protein